LGSGGSNFYLLGTFPAASSGGNGSSINITGTVGNWIFYQTAKIDLLIVRRGGTSINGTEYSCLNTAQQEMDITLYNSSNPSVQVFLATYGQFTAYDLEVSCPLLGFQTVLYEPTGTAYTFNLSTVVPSYVEVIPCRMQSCCMTHHENEIDTLMHIMQKMNFIFTVLSGM
jgi:hypothetical protein